MHTFPIPLKACALSVTDLTHSDEVRIIIAGTIKNNNNTKCNKNKNND